MTTARVVGLNVRSRILALASIYFYAACEAAREFSAPSIPLLFIVPPKAVTTVNNLSRDINKGRRVEGGSRKSAPPLLASAVFKPEI
jgi:hypothetical protein